MILTSTAVFDRNNGGNFPNKFAQNCPLKVIGKKIVYFYEEEYNIFRLLNMNSVKFEKKASNILSVLGNPFRIKILLTIGNGEACVCHLEARLKKRQAFISQHLMALRRAGILDSRREGKYVFYRIADQTIFDLIRTAGRLAGINDENIPDLEKPGYLTKCYCPKCERELKNEVISSKFLNEEV